MPISLGRRPRLLIILICVPAIILSLLLLHINTNQPEWSANLDFAKLDFVKLPASLMRPNLGPFGSVRPLVSGGHRITPSSIERYMLDFLGDVWAKFDNKRHEDEYGLKVGNVTLDQYILELEGMYNKFFRREEEEDYDWVAPLTSRLSLRPPKDTYPGRPNQLSTTDKDSNKLPEMFGKWKEVMPDLQVNVYDDRALEIWVEKVFGETQLHDIWQRLPRIVLKSDIFRYLVLLVEGGIYADSDTGPIIPANDWGMPYTSRTPEVLKHLNRVHSLSGTPDADVWHHPLVDEGGEDGPPSLVIAVEGDAFLYGWSWRADGLARAVQFTQWAMMARPGHPVLLDVVGRALEKTLKIEAEEAAAKANGEEYIEEWALEWTGPGVWTDCIYRYLISRYGFEPESLINNTEAIRVGDVLILPSMTFGAQWPDENGNTEKPFDAVVHGFKGRWRDDDPGVLEFLRQKEEAKKAKEEAEGKAKDEAEGKAKEEAEGKAKEGGGIVSKGENDKAMGDSTSDSKSNDNTKTKTKTMSS